MTRDSVVELLPMLPEKLPPAVDFQSRSAAIAKFLEVLAARCPEQLRSAEAAWFSLLAGLPKEWKGVLPRSNAVRLIAENALPHLPPADAARWVEKLLALTANLVDWRDRVAEGEILRFTASRPAAGDIQPLLEQLAARANALPDRDDRAKALTCLLAGLGRTSRADLRTFRTLGEAVADTEADGCWWMPDNDPPGFPSAAHLVLKALAEYGRCDWSWDAFQELAEFLDAVPEPGHRARGLACAAKALVEFSFPWQTPALCALLERAAALPESGQRSMVFEALLPALIRWRSVLLECEDLCFRFLADVPLRRGNDEYPRRAATLSLVRQFLPGLQAEDADRWVERLLGATAGCQDWHEFSAGDFALLCYAMGEFSTERIQQLLEQLLARIRELPERQAWPTALGFLTGYGGSLRIGPEHFHALREAVTSTGLDNAWTLPDCEAGLSSNAAGLAATIAQHAQAEWSWDAFRSLVQSLEAARIPANRAMGIREAAKGLRYRFDPWSHRALEFLIDRCQALLDGEQLGVALQGISLAVLQRWPSSQFDHLLDRLLAATSLGAEAAEQSLRPWLTQAKEDAAPPPVMLRVLDRVIAFLQQQPFPIPAVLAPALVGFVSGFADRDEAKAGLDKILRMLDGVPLADDSRAHVLKAMLENVQWDFNFGSERHRRYLQLEALLRLRNLEFGPSKLEALDNFRWNQVNSPEYLQVVFEALVQLAGHPECQVAGSSVQAAIAALAAELEKIRAPFAGLDRERFEVYFDAARRLPDARETGQDGRPALPPCISCQAAVLRRFAAVGDPAWREALVGRVLEHARECQDPEHRRQLAIALLEGLETAALDPWQKSVLQKLATFTAGEEKIELSPLRKGIADRLSALGELADASRLARQVSDPQLRSEALANVSLALAPRAPGKAIGVFEEVMSAAERNRLAVELAGIPGMTADSKRVWKLLRAAADDPEVLQRTAGNLLAQSSSEEVHEFLRCLGWSGAATGQGVLEAVLDELVSVDLVTAKKRDRILARLKAENGGALESLFRKAVLDYLVEEDHITAEDRAELLGKRP